MDNEKLKHCTIDCPNFSVFKKNLKDILNEYYDAGYAEKIVFNEAVAEAVEKCNSECYKGWAIK